MVLGLSGTGKTATVDSLLGQPTAAGYSPTRGVEVRRGEIAGVRVTILDTPGLDPSPGAMAANLRKLHAARRAFQKHKVNVVLYLDRLDASRRDHSDLGVVRSITEVFGADLWFSTIMVMTHGAAAPPDGSTGQPLAFDMFVQQRGQQVQQLLRQVAGDNRLMNPVALAENSPACARNGEGDAVLPNGTPWRRHLFMLCFSTRVLHEANSLLKPGDSAGGRGAGGGGNPFMGMKAPPMGWLLSRLVDFK